MSDPWNDYEQSSFFYHFENGSYHFHGRDGDVEFVCDEVTMVFDDDPQDPGPVLLKHGTAEAVESWWNEAKAAYRASGFESFTDHWKLVTGEFPVGEINWLIARTGYRPTFLPKREE